MEGTIGNPNNRNTLQRKIIAGIISIGLLGGLFVNGFQQLRQISTQGSTHDFQTGIGPDIDPPSEPMNLDDLSLLQKELTNLLDGDVQMATINGEGIEPSVVVYLPPGIDPGIFQWGENMATHPDPNSLADRLVRTGALVFAESSSYGVNYSEALEAARQNGGRVNFPTKSGREVAIYADHEHVSVSPALEDTHAVFWASKTPDDVLQLGLYSRGQDGALYDADFVAKDFFRAAVDWYGLENIRAVDAAWSEESSNTRTVNETLAEIHTQGLLTEDLHLITAVKNTFTYRMAAQLGYTEIIVMNISYDPDRPGQILNMNLRFTRPAKPENESSVLPGFLELPSELF